MPATIPGTPATLSRKMNHVIHFFSVIGLIFDKGESARYPVTKSMPQRRNRTVPRASLSGRHFAFRCAISTDWICCCVYLSFDGSVELTWSLRCDFELTQGESMTTFAMRLVCTVCYREWILKPQRPSGHSREFAWSTRSDRCVLDDSWFSCFRSGKKICLSIFLFPRITVRRHLYL